MRCGKYIVDAGEVIGACAGHLPSWAGGNPRMFFAAADEYERLNGRLFTQALFAIPNELSDRDALLLAYHYAEAATKNGAPYALAVHRGGVEVVDGETVSAAPQEADEEGLPPHNRHGHLLICERIDDGLERTAREWFRRANKKEPALGGAAKDRTMNGGDWVPEVRRLCADYINYGLKRAGVSERVTCESHETRIARAEAAGDEETAEYPCCQGSRHPLWRTPRIWTVIDIEVVSPHANAADATTAQRGVPLQALQAPAPTTVRPAAIDLLTAPRVVTLGQIPVVVVRSATALRARPQTDVHFAWSSAA